MEKAAAAILFVKMAAMVVVALALAPPRAEAAITCPTVANTLTPCFNYVMYGGAWPPTDCCNGIRSLYNQATATADRQEVCSCLKSVAGSATTTMISNAAGLPEKCGVTIPYKISPNTDCSTVR